MSLAERCDEIVRLIDETLADLGADLTGAPADSPTSAAIPTLASSPGTAERRRSRLPSTPDPDRAVAGF